MSLARRIDSAENERFCAKKIPQLLKQNFDNWGIQLSLRLILILQQL